MFRVAAFGSSHVDFFRDLGKEREISRNFGRFKEIVREFMRYTRF